MFHRLLKSETRHILRHLSKTEHYIRTEHHLQ